MEKIRQFIDTARVAFGRLTQREQFIVVGGGAAASLLILIIIGMLVGGAISREERRVQVKTEQLSQVLALQGEYKARELEAQERLRKVRSGDVRLVQLVEASAKQASVDIGQLRPEEGEPSGDGVVESKVDLRASGLSADRLQEFLNLLEAGPNLVVVRRLKINRPYRKDTADIELTVSTFKRKG